MPQDGRGVVIEMVPSHLGEVSRFLWPMIGHLERRRCRCSRRGPLLGGFLTTYLSWRVGFGLEATIIVVVLIQIHLVKDVPLHWAPPDRCCGCRPLHRRQSGLPDWCCEFRVRQLSSEQGKYAHCSCDSASLHAPPAPHD